MQPDSTDARAFPVMALGCLVVALACRLVGSGAWVWFGVGAAAFAFLAARVRP